MKISYYVSQNHFPPSIIFEVQAKVPYEVIKKYQVSEQTIPSIGEVMVDILKQGIKKMDEAIAKIDRDFPYLAKK